MPFDRRVLLTRSTALLAGGAFAMPVLARPAAAQAPAADNPRLSERSMGQASAPMVVQEFFSLTCSHCGAFGRDTWPQVKRELVQTGKIRFIWRDFPLDQIALRAAVIAHCAGPERYPAFVDVFFQQQASWIRAADPVQALKQLARLGGLGAEQADACLADKAMEDAVLKSRLEAQQKFDVKSTPTFIVNGKSYSGEKSVEDFAAIIDPLLSH